MVLFCSSFGSFFMLSSEPILQVWHKRCKSH
jgi:hypothetical protein